MSSFKTEFNICRTDILTIIFLWIIPKILINPKFRLNKTNKDVSTKDNNEMSLFDNNILFYSNKCKFCKQIIYLINEGTMKSLDLEKEIGVWKRW